MKLSAAGVELNGLGEICLLEFEWGRKKGGQVPGDRNVRDESLNVYLLLYAL